MVVGDIVGRVGDWIALVDAGARELTLFAGAGLLVGGIDDLLIDLVFLALLVRDRLRPAPAPAPAGPLPPGAARIAVLIAAWREERVIGAMLEHATRQLRGDCRIFVACYPNDPGTIDAVAAAALRDPRICLVVNPRPGPTTKADNLNAAWGAAERAGPFAAMLLHDAEDVVHPGELDLVASAIAGGADMAQLPVVPLIDPRSRLIGGHYADEFAEAHIKAMRVRAALGAALPMAGTGCAVSAPMLRRIASARGGQPFDAASLTEDYEMGLAIAAMGGRAVFVRRRGADGALVAVRAYFPDGFAAAARQKARWMVGIALAGWDRTGWARRRQLADHWMRMRDRRSPLAVVVLAAAYASLLALAASGALHLATGRPVAASLPGWLMGANAAMLGWRLAARVACTTHEHGWREGLVAIPRFVVGNGIALAAGPRALWRYLPILFGREPEWDKTEHRFPEPAAIAPADLSGGLPGDLDSVWPGAWSGA